MTKYMTTGAKLQSKATTKEYEDNYDRIFRKKEVKQKDKKNVKKPNTP